MATIKIEPVLMVECSSREHAWAQSFFNQRSKIVHISYETFHEEVTDFAMQDEPEYAHELVRNVFHYFGGIEAPDSLIFF